MTAAADPMSKLSHAQQHAIFSRHSWTTDGKIRVRATHSTEPLLRLAGIRNPVALEYYNLPAKRDGRGFLILDEELTRQSPPVSDSDDSLFVAGGIFSGETAMEAPAAADCKRLQLQPELAALCETARSRVFEISIDTHLKARVQVVLFEDQALPSPMEPERWEPLKPDDASIHAAVGSLHRAARLSAFEKI